MYGHSKNNLCLFFPYSNSCVHLLTVTGGMISNSVHTVAVCIETGKKSVRPWDKWKIIKSDDEKPEKYFHYFFCCERVIVNAIVINSVKNSRSGKYLPFHFYHHYK